jgi:hypothetical protein
MLFMCVKQSTKWRVDRFDARRLTTLAHVSKGLVGTKTCDNTLLKLQQQATQDKLNVALISKREIHAFLQSAASACGMTHISPLTSISMPCVTSRDIRSSWMADGGLMNQKRIAWMYFYFPTVIHQKVLNKTHQEIVEKVVMELLNVEYSNEDELLYNQRSCIQQMYARSFNDVRTNVMRSSTVEKHKIHVMILNPALKNCKKIRPKTVFYIMDMDKGHVRKVR